MGTVQSRINPKVDEKESAEAANFPEAEVFRVNPNADMIDLPGSGIGHRFQIGVTEYFFSWLKDYIQQQGETFPEDISTEQLVWGPSSNGPTGPSPMKWNIFKETENHKCSFIVWCLIKGFTSDKQGRPLFGPVTTFVSHAWKGSFVALKNSVIWHTHQHASQSPSPETSSTTPPLAGAAANGGLPVFFVDIFVVNQHIPPWKEQPCVGMDYALQKPIEKSLKTLLVMSPFEDPVPLKRAWCIYEICNTKRLGATLDVTMPASEHTRFIEALTKGEFDFNDWITNIDIEQAGSFDPSDKEMIMELVQKSPGAAAGLNRTVVIVLCEWLSTQGRAALDSLPEDERGHSKLILNLANVILRQGKPDEAEVLFNEVVRCRRSVFGDMDVRTLEGLHMWGRFQRTRGNFENAATVLEETVAGRENLLGKAHEDTLTSRMELAEVWRHIGKLNDADVSIREVIKGWREQFATIEDKKEGVKTDKEMHLMYVNSLESLKVHAAIMLQQGEERDEDEAQRVLNELLQGRVKLFGPRNPATLDVIVLKAQFQLSSPGGSTVPPITDDDIRLLNITLDVLRGTLGDTHPRTLHCICILSQLYKVTIDKDAGEKEAIAYGKVDKSMALVQEAVAGYRSTLGDDHPDTIRAKKLQSCRQEDINAFIGEYTTCFDPYAKVLLSDGTSTKYAKDIQIGDQLSSSCGIKGEEGRTVTVTGHIIQKQGQNCRDLVQIGDLLISKMHYVFHHNKWVRPEDYPQAIKVHRASELHNFIVDTRESIVVNGIVMSSIGTFCPGVHDLHKKSNHALWASEHIVNVFKQHPMWPVVVLDTEKDNFLNVIKDKAFAAEYVSISAASDGVGNAEHSLGGPAALALLLKHGWKKTSGNV